MAWQLGERAMATNIRASLAPSTGGGYERMWKKYVDFCSRADRARRSSKTVCAFLSFLVQTSTGMGGVEGARSALRHHFLVEEPDLACPTNGQEVMMVLKKLSRRFNVPVTKKAALAKVDFYKILVTITKQDENGKVKLCRVRLAAQVALVYLSFARYEESSVLKMEQVTSERDYLIVTFKKGKTYQFGEARMSDITSRTEAAVNPVEVICCYMNRLKKVQGNSKGFLFPALRYTRNGDLSMNEPATYKAVLDQFKSIVKEAGVASSPSAFGLHFMR